MPLAASAAVEAHGQQHMAGLDGPAGAGRAGRGSHAGGVEQEHQRLAARPRRTADGRGRAARRRARRRPDGPGHRRQQPVDQAVAQGRHPGAARRPAGCRPSGQGRGQADDAGHVVGAAAPPRSWPPPWSTGATGRCRLRTARAPTPWGPPNLWALIATRSAPACSRRHVEPGSGLDGVGVEDGPRGPAPDQPGHLASGWTVPISLLTSITETRPTSACRPRPGVEIDDAARVGRHLPQARRRTAPGQPPGRSRARRGARWPSTRSAGRADRRRPRLPSAGHGEVVGLGPAAGEDHLTGSAPRRAADLLAGVVDGPPGTRGPRGGPPRGCRSAPAGRAAWPRRPPGAAGWWRRGPGRPGRRARPSGSHPHRLDVAELVDARAGELAAEPRALDPTEGQLRAWRPPCR